jgi:hypothetical protein
MRNPETPLILWICAAVCAHFVFAEGGEKVAESYEDSSYLLQMGARARGAAARKFMLAATAYPGAPALIERL